MSRLLPAGMRVLATGLGAALLLTGCADKEPTPPAAPPAASGASGASGASTNAPASAPTTQLPGMPTPVSSGDSPVDSGRLRATEDLPTVFQCPSNPAPIRIPATPAATGATVPAAPDVVVCASGLAKEALYLWYTPTPEAKLGALTEALDRAKYVHAGPNWVAAGMLDPTMGTVGGEVYR